MINPLKKIIKSAFWIPRNGTPLHFWVFRNGAASCFPVTRNRATEDFGLQLSQLNIIKKYPYTFIQLLAYKRTDFC